MGYRVEGFFYVKKTLLQLADICLATGATCLRQGGELLEWMSVVETQTGSWRVGRESTGNETLCCE